MNDETNQEDDKIRPAFDQAVSAGQGEDDVKMAMIQAGASFKTVTRLYNQYMVDAGLAVSKEEKTEIVEKVASKAKALDTEEGFTKAVNALVEKAAGVNEKSAASLIRAWAKSQDPAVEVYKKQKGGGEGRTGFKARFYTALVANPKMTKEECHEYLQTAEGTSANIQKRESVYQAIRQMANDIAGAKAA